MAYKGVGRGSLLNLDEETLVEIKINNSLTLPSPTMISVMRMIVGYTQQLFILENLFKTYLILN